MLAANPVVTTFELDRNGDDIALHFILGTGVEQTGFRLFGSKRDFYSLSMGGRLETTLTKLAQADPNIESAGAKKSGEQITLRLAYAWPEGVLPAFAVRQQPVPEPAPEPPPAPAVRQARPAAPEPETPPKRNPNYYVPARSPEDLAPSPAEAPPAAPPAAVPPPAAEIAVAMEAPVQLPESTAATVHESRATTAPAQATPAPPASHSQAELDYRAARDAGTLQAFTRFLDAHPDSPHAAEAQARAGELREQAAYAKARERDDAAGYQGFLKNFPNSNRRAEIEARAQALEEGRRRLEADRRTRAAEAQRLRAVYDQTRKLNSPEAYRIFLAAYPDAAEAATVKKRLAAIEADEVAFRGAHGSEQHLDGYLALYPDGRHAEAARTELQTLRSRRMEAEYRTAQAGGTHEAYQAFLEQWPHSPRVREARAALATLEQSATTTQPAAGEQPGSSAAVKLVAHRVAVAPKVDGDGSDRAWQGAPALVTPLRGSTGVQQLQVRAVHDGSAIYFLLQWADPTRDAVNRPWNWSPAATSYHQSTQLDDGVSIMLFGDTAPKDACMLSGAGWRGDNWTWRANWSSIAGLADDTLMRASKNRLPQSNPYPAADGNGQVWISRQSDEGTPGWSFFIPLEFQGPVVASYQAAKARGSRADVAARGVWSGAKDGTPLWTVEFSRALDTHHSDDQPLRVGQPAAIAFAVYDHSDQADHSASTLVWLQLQETSP